MLSVPTGRREVVFVYDHFYPDFTAGGPIASLMNLGNLLATDVPVKVLSSAFEYQTGRMLDGVITDKWTKWKHLSVLYATNTNSIVGALKSFNRGKSTAIYLNGFFSVKYFVIPLIIGRIRGNEIIISPRGMFQAGALRKGTWKKRLYILMVRASGLLRRVKWHATDNQEGADIMALIGSSASIQVISNVPLIRLGLPAQLVKEPGELRLIYYSLISEKKNLLFLLDLLASPGLEKVTLTIAGPVKDRSYWRKCTKEIDQLELSNRVSYMGEIPPEKGVNIISGYHALALPTLGENFGHAIIEMLSASRPVLISDKTPWNDITKFGAGYAVPLEKVQWRGALLEMVSWTDHTYKTKCAAAFAYYDDKFNFEKLKDQYKVLFTAETPS